jgi:hypothetical protein
MAHLICFSCGATLPAPISLGPFAKPGALMTFCDCQVLNVWPPDPDWIEGPYAIRVEDDFEAFDCSVSS